MGYKKLSIIIISLMFLINFVSAVPQITIHSPQNTTYDSNKILLNVTSNEVVDFFIKGSRGERMILVENVTSLESFLYVKEGSYTYTIWANNSNGENNESVTFSSSVSNPINVTSCGYLYSSDAAYILQNDVSDSYKCIRMMELRNVSLDLNGNTITSGERGALELRFSSDAEVFNGSINGSAQWISGAYPWIIHLEGTKFKLKNLNINGYTGIFTFSLGNTVFENVTINSTLGFYFASVTGIYFINSTIIWNGEYPSYYVPAAFFDQSDHSEIYLEEVNIIGFPDYDLSLEGTYTDFYLRNTVLNMSKIKYPIWVADTRFFEQHLILINVTDQFNESGSGVVEIVDDGTFPRRTGTDAVIETLSNPTAQLLVATDENGIADVWLTEKLVYVRSSSPPVITEYDFSLYNLTARSWDSNATEQLNLTDVNSTIPISFKLTLPKALPTCTIAQMLDLNNDDVVNIQDSLIIIRYITSQPVSINSTKQCEGINLNPF